MKITNTCHLQSVYREIADGISIDIAIKLHDMYGGTQVSFPKRLLSSSYVTHRLQQEYNGHNIKALAIQYELSEKSVRRKLKHKEPSVNEKTDSSFLQAIGDKDNG